MSLASARLRFGPADAGFEIEVFGNAETKPELRAAVIAFEMRVRNFEARDVRGDRHIEARRHRRHVQHVDRRIAVADQTRAEGAVVVDVAHGKLVAKQVARSQVLGQRRRNLHGVPARVAFDKARLAWLGDQRAVIGNSGLHIEGQPFAFAAKHRVDAPVFGIERILTRIAADTGARRQRKIRDFGQSRDRQQATEHRAVGMPGWMPQKSIGVGIGGEAELRDDRPLCRRRERRQHGNRATAGQRGTSGNHDRVTALQQHVLRQLLATLHFRVPEWQRTHTPPSRRRMRMSLTSAKGVAPPASASACMTSTGLLNMNSPGRLTLPST